MNFEDLSPEQKEKARACKTIDELIAFAKEAGFELTNEELEGIAGGICKQLLEREAKAGPSGRWYGTENA